MTACYQRAENLQWKRVLRNPGLRGMRGRNTARPHACGETAATRLTEQRTERSVSPCRITSHVDDPGVPARPAAARAQQGIRRYRHPHPGARHRREHGDVQHRERRAVEPVSVRRDRLAHVRQRVVSPVQRVGAADLRGLPGPPARQPAVSAPRGGAGEWLQPDRSRAGAGAREGCDRFRQRVSVARDATGARARAARSRRSRGRRTGRGHLPRVVDDPLRRRSGRDRPIDRAGRARPTPSWA